ncbi:hypothetical protein BDV36DRAFT_254329 [Aspergillus pseudocaelatus]|uniref:Uncharacterized protein n=1 Tax=Aspergillus pseudocaelatus TaxID=1825620 RepID=A0ABQ6WMP1_9EURO|nr:hypothetical protein BDV36DRAFT_254329 [Aspergillus pseudocaelatus]
MPQLKNINPTTRLPLGHPLSSTSLDLFLHQIPQCFVRCVDIWEPYDEKDLNEMT